MRGGSYLNRDGELILLTAGILLVLFVSVFYEIYSIPDVRSDPKNGAAPSVNRLSLSATYPNLHRLTQLHPDVGEYLPIVRAAVKKHSSTYELDTLLVLALIRHESNFEARSISPVGAAGPMQFMPRTGREMGLDPVYHSETLREAFEVDNRSRRLYSRAVRLMKSERYDLLPSVVRRWKKVDERASELFRKYREQLRECIQGLSPSELARVDQRFVIAESVPRGVKYLAKLFRERNGDLREALSAYNAGPTSVRQHDGIPPYDQTVNYQNRIVNTYRKYRRYLQEGGRSSESEQLTALK